MGKNVTNTFRLARGSFYKCCNSKINKTFVTVNERSFPGSSNLSANVFDINVESSPPSNNALNRNVLSLFEAFVGSTS